MITRPTTDELIRDCCRELTDEIVLRSTTTP